jgi:hypothetical protein
VNEEEAKAHWGAVTPREKKKCKGFLHKRSDYQVCKKKFFSGSYLMKLAALPQAEL